MLGTLDPRIPGLGAWTPIEMANSSAITIDLSNYSFAGEPAPASTTLDALSNAELDDLLDVLAEVEDEDYDPGDELSDPELEALMQAAGDYYDAAEQFDAAAEQAREDARAAAAVEDVMFPARRDEDRMQRIIGRAASGVYDGQQMAFSADSAAVEITLANGGQGPCGPVDEYGRCSSRYHDLECGHSQGADWLAAGPPRSSYDASLANFATGLALDMAPRTVWDDP